ncbi:MerR family DNA-binding protein [Burkholderia multivorans]|nr:MerR family DNA-binding protein [Burkholderia multivorans]
MVHTCPRYLSGHVCSIGCSNGSRCVHRTDTDEIHTLRFIRQARRLGFLVEDIRKLLTLWQDRSRASAEVKSIALGHVAELDKRIAELTDMRNTLMDLAAHCHGDARPECPILARLAEPVGEPH